MMNNCPITLTTWEEELAEVRGTVEEGRGREGEWIKSREHLQADLEAAEKRVEEVYQELETQRGLRSGKRLAVLMSLLNLLPSLPPCRAGLELELSKVMSSFEKTAAAHGEEQQLLAEQLTTQKQLASKYSDCVSELEKEGRLRGLELRELKKDLETEKSLSSKLYDDVREEYMCYTV